MKWEEKRKELRHKIKPNHRDIDKQYWTILFSHPQVISNFLISLLGRFYANLLINNVLCSQLDKFYLQFIHIYLEKYHITSLVVFFFLQINTLTFVMHNKWVQKKVNQYQGKVCLGFFFSLPGIFLFCVMN